MSLVLQSSGGGSVTVQEPTTASNFTATLPAATGDVMVSGNMPAFSAYATSAQTLSSSTDTKILFPTEAYDTNNNFASSRFTPTVAGYYYVCAGVGIGASTTTATLFLWKNGSSTQNMMSMTGCNSLTGSALVYCNGSTDYLEIYANFTTGQNTFGNIAYTFFQGTLVRSA